MKTTLLVGSLLALSLTALLLSTPFSDRVQSQSVRAPEIPVRIEVPTVSTGPPIHTIDPRPLTPDLSTVNTTMPNVARPEVRSAPEPAGAARADAIAIRPGPGPGAESDSPDCSVHSFSCAQSCDPLPTVWSSCKYPGFMSTHK
jgi:hypothetical protein